MLPPPVKRCGSERNGAARLRVGEKSENLTVMTQRRNKQMRKIIFGALPVLLTVVVAIAAAASTLYAIDSSNRFFAYGVGYRTCEDYVKLREKRLDSLEQPHPRYTKDEQYEIADGIVEHWIAGFLTAHNLYVSDTYDVVGKLTMDDLKTRLEKSCRANARQYFAEAMFALAKELNPQRVKAVSGK